MPVLPPWLDEVLRQSPLLAATLAVAYYLYRHIAKQHDERLAAEKRFGDEKVALLSQSHDKVVESLLREIERLEKDKKELIADRDRLRKQVEKKPP